MRKLKFSNSKPTIQDSFRSFIKKKEAEGLRDASIKSYREKIEPFFDFVDPYISNAEDFSMELLEAYTASLRNQGLAPSTVTSYIRSIRVYLYFCMEQGWLESFQIKLPKGEKPIKETYTEAELKILLKKPNLKTCSFTEYKTWVFISYILGTGNRLSTALSLIWGDVDFDKGYILMRTTKNRKGQVIPLSKTLAAVLLEYKTYRGGSDDQFIFCNCYGQKAAPRSYQDAVKRFNLSRGVKKTSIHALRHTFAKEWVLAGGDVFRLQKILGHSDISVTKEYVTMFGADLKEGFDNFTVLSKFSRGSKLAF